MKHKLNVAIRCRQWVTSKKDKQRSVFFLLFSSYLITMLVSMSGSYVFLFENEQKARETAARTRATVLEQYITELDYQAENIQRLENALLFNDPFHLFLKQVPVYSIEDLQKELKASRMSGEEVIDYFVYLRTEDMIVTPGIRMPYSRFYSIMHSFPSRDAGVWQEQLRQYTYNHYYRPAEMMKLYGNEEKEIISYLQTIPLQGEGEPLAQLVLLLDAEKMRAKMDRLAEVTDTGLYFVNPQGEIVLASTGAPMLSSDEIRELSKKKNIENMVNKNKTVVNCMESEKGSFEVLMTMSNEQYNASLNATRTRFILQFFMLTALGLALSVFFARKNFRPIREIQDMLTISPQKSDNINEFEHIKKSILQSIERQKELGDRLDADAPVIRSDFFLKLLQGVEPRLMIPASSEKGREGDADLYQELQAFGFAKKSECFVVVAITLDMISAFFTEETAYPDLNLALGRVIIENIGTEMIGGLGFPCAFVNPEKNLCAFIINLEDDEEEKNKRTIDELFHLFSEILNQNFSLQYFAGISSIHYGLRQLRECMDEARKSLDYGALNGKKGTVHYENIAGLELDYYYPIEQEIQLVNFLKVGDASSAIAAIESVFEVNFEHKKIGTKAGRCLIVELTGTLTKVMNSNLVLADQQTSGAEGLLQRMAEAATYEEIRGEMIQIVQVICELAQKKQNNQTERLVDRIEEFIKNSEDWLDLATIAGKFDITPQYLSTVFKKYKSENVKEYISKIRLQKAKEFLEQTGYTVDEIAKRLGYANETGLNRLFKKYEGITPGAYRASRSGK